MRVTRLKKSEKARKIQRKHQKQGINSVKSAEGFFLAFYFYESYTLLTKRFVFLISIIFVFKSPLAKQFNITIRERISFMDEKQYTSISELQARPLPPGFDTVSGPLQYNLLNDLMFRIVFEVNQRALKALLCSLLHLKADDIVEMEIKNPIRLGKRVADKKYIYDIYLLLNNQQKVHLELQVVQQSFWTDRSLCYLCRDFGNLNAGDTYDQVKPLVQIDILDFDLYEGAEEFYSVYHLAHDKTGRIYSSKLALHVLQLNKEEHATEEDKLYQIDYWARLFKATTWEELKMLAQEQEILQSTVETIYCVSADDYTREEIRAREDELRIQRTIENELKSNKEKIAEQRKQLLEQSKLLTEKSEQIAEQDKQLAERDKQLAEQDKQLAEYNNQLAAKDAYIAELEARLKEQK